MIQTARLSPPNSLLLVLDPRTGVLPETLSREAVAATGSGLAIGTLAEYDGETEVYLSGMHDLRKDMGGLLLRWEGELETSGRLGVLTTYNEVLIEMEAPSMARVQIWTNDDSEPDTIWVAVE